MISCWMLCNTGIVWRDGGHISVLPGSVFHVPGQWQTRRLLHTDVWSTPGSDKCVGLCVRLGRLIITLVAAGDIWFSLVCMYVSCVCACARNLAQILQLWFKSAFSIITPDNSVVLEIILFVWLYVSVFVCTCPSLSVCACKATHKFCVAFDETWHTFKYGLLGTPSPEGVPKGQPKMVRISVCFCWLGPLIVENKQLLLGYVLWIAMQRLMLLLIMSLTYCQPRHWTYNTHAIHYTNHFSFSHPLRPI